MEQKSQKTDQQATNAALAALAAAGNSFALVGSQQGAFTPPVLAVV